MNVRCYYTDGRTAEERNLDERVRRIPIPKGYQLTWFSRTDEVDPDGFVVFRESVQERTMT
jgi:hypothetical protein